MISKKLALICVTISVITLTACQYNGKGRTYFPPRTAIPANWALQEQEKNFELEVKEEERIKAQKKAEYKRNMRYHKGQKTDYIGKWWKVFDDRTLEKIIEQLTESDLNLNIAKTRIKQARELKGKNRTTLNPNLNFYLDETHNTEHHKENTTLFDSSWEKDLFNKERNQKLDSSQITTQLFEASYNDIMISMISELSTNYINLRTYQNRLSIARQIKETLYKNNSQNTNELTNVILKNANVAMPLLKSEIELAKNRIGVLLGKNPRSSDLNFFYKRQETVPDTNIRVVVGIPANTIRKRPDITKIERKMVAEIARVGINNSKLSPSLKLNGSIGLESLDDGSLFKNARKIFSLGSIIKWSIFDKGDIQKNLKHQKAVKRDTVISYEQSIIDALAEVNNAITKFTHQKIYEHDLKQTYIAANKNLNTARSKYISSKENFTYYQNATLDKLNTEDKLIQSKRKSAIELINLYKALGGDWHSFADNRIIYDD